jgi:PAS domain S-box-containing protein
MDDHQPRRPNENGAAPQPAPSYVPEGGVGRIPRSALDALATAIGTLDETGMLLAVNRAWRDLAEAGSGLGQLNAGDNCLACFDRAAADGHPLAGEIASGLRAVIAGKRTSYLHRDVRCTSQENRWFDLAVRKLDDPGAPQFLLSLDDVTERHHALEIMLETDARHRHAERIAKLGHWRLVVPGSEWQTGAIEYSDQAAAILGLPAGQNHDFNDMRRRIHPDDLAHVLDVYKAPNTDGYVVEYRVIRPDGSIVVVQETGEAMTRTADGATLEFGTIQDVTEQRRAADRLRQLNEELERLVAERTAALAERESLLRRAQGLAGIGHYIWRKEDEERQGSNWHKGLDYSWAIADIFGVAPQELAVADQAYIERFVHPDDRAQVEDAYRNHYRERLFNRLPLEYRIVRSDGRVRHVVEIIERISGEGDEVTEALGMIQDITTRKEAELAQRESEARLKAFMDNAPFIMSIKSTDGRMLMINREGAASYESTEEALRGHLTQELIPHESGRAITEMSREVVATGAAVTREIHFPNWSRYHWSLEIEFPIWDARGRMTAIGGFAVDITEQKKAELALRESESRLRAIFDHVPVTLSLSDRSGRYTMLNRRFLEAVGKNEEDVVGRTAAEIFWPEAAAVLDARKAQVMNSLKPVTYEVKVPWSTGTRDLVFTHFPIIDDGALVAVGTISMDLTEQRATEAALQQAQKMELVGQLTGGIAHDFNNLLGAIIGNLDLLALELGGRDHARELLERAVSAAERGASMIQRLLAFSRRQTLSPRLIDVNRQIQEMRPLLEHSLGSGLSIAIRTAAENPYCRIDPVQFEAALLNLAINARDAMPDGGRLVVETANVTMAADAVENPVPGPYVMIVVADNGAGMSRDVLAHAFEPFFTTKPVGKGTGLGLSMVHGFVKQSGGHVHIDSQPGRGTTVGLFIPCVTENDADEEDADMLPAPSERPGRGEKILIVESDPDILACCASALERLGYRCVPAADASEALRELGRHDDIVLVFSGLFLSGGVHGPDLLRQARQDRPGLKALYTSGSGDAERAAEARLPAGDLFIAKPYRLRDLGHLLADILAEPQA